MVPFHQLFKVGVVLLPQQVLRAASRSLRPRCSNAQQQQWQVAKPLAKVWLRTRLRMRRRRRRGPATGPSQSSPEILQQFEVQTKMERNTKFARWGFTQ